MKKFLAIFFSIVLLLQCVPGFAAEKANNTVAETSEQCVMRFYPTGRNAISGLEAPYAPDGNFTLYGINSVDKYFDGHYAMLYAFGNCEED